MAMFQPSLLVVASIVLRLAAALQVTPNSPCAAVCMDKDGLDKSDPNSSSTKGADMSCDDDLFETSGKGKKFQSCLTCLQDSSFAQGSESDQKWFLYNLRYSIDYCILGFPGNDEVGSNPCITSEACGPLASSLKKGILEPSGTDAYAYCDAGGDSTLGYAYEKCQQCIRAGGSHYYLSNFLTALEAGCRQQPEHGIVLGLNSTVFTTTAVGIVDPSSPDPDGGSSSGGIRLSTPIVVGIAVGAAVAVVALAGCLFMHIRKRRNRRASTTRRRRRASPLSFQCQTHLTPRDANFRLGADAGPREKPYVDPAAALGSNPISSSPWMSPRATDYGNGEVNDKHHQGKFPNITVTTCLPSPPAVHASPQRASPDDYASPQSATSTRSTAPLLHHHHQHRPYVPSEYSGSPQQQSVASFSPIGPSPVTHSPISYSPVQSEPRWEDQRLVGAAGRNLTGNRNAPWAGTGNVEVRIFSTSFPPPPKK